MNFKSCIAALGLSFLCLPGHAGVVYEWRGLNNEPPRGIKLVLEFEERIVQSGSFAFDLSAEEDPHAGARPGLGLIALEYSFPAFWTSNYDAIYYGQDRGFGYPGLPVYGPVLRMEISFMPGGFLTGNIMVRNFDSQIAMASNGRVFTVYDAESDASMASTGCGWPTNVKCFGATGLIRRADVPESGSLALIGIGLFAASRIRRRKTH